MTLVFNSGSSSIKIALFKKNKKVYSLHFKHYSKENYTLEGTNLREFQITEHDYYSSYKKSINILEKKKVIKDENDIKKIAHRVVHGGEEFNKIVKLNSQVLKRIEGFNLFAPLHNPPALKVIQKIRVLRPDVDQFAVFDTAFHTTIPKENFLYGLPYGYYENLKVRKFGFHGVSYEYVVKSISNFPEKAIICHLGSGSSVCAVKNKKSFATSFGFSPDENLIMATRSGEIDYTAVNFIKNKLKLTDSDVTTLINKESGLLGISGYTNNMKQLVDDYSSKKRARLAVDMYVAKVVEFICNFFVMLEGCELLVFTGGIGSESGFIREKIADKIKILGLDIDRKKNNYKDVYDISSKNNKILAIKTDEEQHIANQLSEL